MHVTGKALDGLGVRVGLLHESKGNPFDLLNIQQGLVVIQQSENGLCATSHPPGAACGGVPM